MNLILIIEDEVDIANLVAMRLDRDGFKTAMAHDGRSGLMMAQEIVPDLILLDVMLPVMDGAKVMKELKRFPTTQHIPVIMVTARGQTEDRVSGLELGADDYVTKPFVLKELTLRIEAVLRRTKVEGAGGSILEAGPFRFDSTALICLLDKQALDLTLTEYKLLYYLADRANEACDRNDLFRAVWGYSDSAQSRTLDTHIKRLRLKLGDHANQLETIRQVGYQLTV